MKKFIWLVLSAQLVLAACAHQSGARASVMDRPIEFDTTAEFYRDLQSLETELSEADYQRLTDAIGNLQAQDLENVSYESFHASLAGLSPNQIIEKAELVCQRVEC